MQRALALRVRLEAHANMRAEAAVTVGGAIIEHARSFARDNERAVSIRPKVATALLVACRLKENAFSLTVCMQ